MASVLSVDAQEFIPGNGIVGSKHKLCSSLSVDAPVFVPVVTTENQKENSSSTSIGKQENKSSVVQRRGRFTQTDSRTQPNQKNVDIFVKTSTLIKKENNDGKNIKSSSDHPGNKNSSIAKEGGDKKKLKQSFSLRRRNVTSRDIEEKIIRDSDVDIQTNKTPQNNICSSGESKPIILWSSIVKQEPNKEKSEDDNINQKTSVKNNTVADENPVITKKYSKNKVTRTKNVLSEPPNDKYGQRAINEWKRKDLKDEMLKGIHKPISVEFSKCITGTEELLNHKSEKDFLTEVGVCNITTHKPSPVIKNPKRRNKEKCVKSGLNGDFEKPPTYNNFNCEGECSRNYVQEEAISDISNVQTQKRNDSKVNLRRSLDEWLGNKGNDKNNTVKKINNSGKNLNEGSNVPNKALKNSQLLKQNSNNNVIPDENKSENIKSLNLSDNSSFPALAMGSIPTTIPLLSYSAVAKKILPVNTNPIICNETKNMLNVTHDIPLSEDEKRIMKKRQKALKRKMKVKQKKQEAKMDKPTQEVIEKTLEKASEKEMTFDLSDMCTKLLKMPPVEKKSQKYGKSKKVRMSTGVISVVSGLAKKNTPDGRRVERNKYGTTHTIMDGITPIRKRGKERETPKKKRPTLLKKVITAERERKRVLLENKSSEGVDVNMEVPLLEEHTSDSGKPNVEEIEHISEFPEDIWKKIHSKKFREYCDHVLTKDINQLTYNLLVTLQKFQDRVYHENRTKYKQKRRFILGLREVLKHLKLKRLKAVIIAPNIERISSKGGLDDYLGSIISICNEQRITKIFAMNRHVLGRVIKKLAPVSVVGIFDYDGAHEIFNELVNHVQLAKVAYMEKVNELHVDNNKKESDVSPQKTGTSILLDSIGNEEQIRKNNEVDEVRQHMLNNIYADEYQFYDAESESDAWVTDTESTPL